MGQQVIKKMVVTVFGDDTTDYSDDEDELEASIRASVEEAVASYNEDAGDEETAVSVTIIAE